MNIIIGNKSFLSKSMQSFFDKKKINYVVISVEELITNKKKINYSTIYNNFYFYSGFNKYIKEKYVENNIALFQNFIDYINDINLNRSKIYYPSSVYLDIKVMSNNEYVANYIKTKKKIEKILIKTASDNINVWIGRLPTILNVNSGHINYSSNSFISSIIHNAIKNYEITINTQHVRHIISTNELFNYMLEISNSLNEENIILDSITNYNLFNFKKLFNSIKKNVKGESKFIKVSESELLSKDELICINPTKVFNEIPSYDSISKEIINKVYENI